MARELFCRVTLVDHVTDFHGVSLRALGPAWEAVDIRLRLADAEPAAYLADLAASLDILDIVLSKVGDNRAALDSTRGRPGSTGGWPTPSPPPIYLTSPCPCGLTHRYAPPAA